MKRKAKKRPTILIGALTPLGSKDCIHSNNSLAFAVTQRSVDVNNALPKNTYVIEANIPVKEKEFMKFMFYAA